MRRFDAHIVAFCLCAALISLCVFDRAYGDDLGPGEGSFSLSSASEYAGDDLYETAAIQSRAAYPSGCSRVIIVGQRGWLDAFSATGLAGALDCPIVFTSADRLAEAARAEVERLGASKAFIVGGPAVVSENVLSELSSEGLSCERIYGEDQYDTQRAVYQYGADRELWGPLVVAASGSPERFADALSISPVAFAKKAPVFLVDDDGLLPEESVRILLEAGTFSEALGVGGAAVLSERTMGTLGVVALSGGGSSSAAERVAGTTLYDTSAEVAAWAVRKGLLSWNDAAFATSNAPYDALAGGVLQGKDRAVLLLVGGLGSSTIDVAADHRGAIDRIRFFGGTAVVPAQLRLRIGYRLGMSLSSISLSTACMMQNPELPTGCESVALANDLTYYGFSLSKFEIADRWLPRSSWDWVTAYQGNPYVWGGGSWNSCCAPALTNAANDYLESHGSGLRAYNITGTSFAGLYDYISQGYPVVVWNTMYMNSPGLSSETRWHEDGAYRLYDNSHTVVLRGFDRSNDTVYVADSISGYVTRDADSFGWIYSRIGSQAVVIM